MRVSGFHLTRYLEAAGGSEPRARQVQRTRRGHTLRARPVPSRALAGPRARENSQIRIRKK